MPHKAPNGLARRPEARMECTEGMQRARLSAQMKEVLEVMAYQGLSVRDAARKIGWDPGSAARAFRRPHVLSAYNQLVSDIRRNAGQNAYLRIVNMAIEADSEHVRLSANQWLAGVDGVAPVKRVEARHSVNVSFGGFDYDIALGHDVSLQEDGVDPESA